MCGGAWNRSMIDRATTLGLAFFDRPTVNVARDLVGRWLISHVGGVVTAGRIVECEAYPTEDSTAHSFRGPTARCASMFERPGTLYVYFTYGMHHCVNVVTESQGVGAAVLIRALEPCQGIAMMRRRRGANVPDRDLCRGPARLCVALGIDRRLDGIDTCAPNAAVFIADARTSATDAAARTTDGGGRTTRGVRVATSPRVGVVGTHADVVAKRRFFEANSVCLSSVRPGRVAT